MELGLDGKRAVVTGASKGIGLAVSRTLLAEGARVVGASRGPAPELESAGGVSHPVDLTDPAGPEALVAAARQRLGGVDLLVNNVGGGDPPDIVIDGFLAEEDDHWWRAWNLNLLATVRTTRAALPELLAAGGGAVVNISSTGARQPGPPVAYSTAKAALTALGKALSEEFGPRGVRVNTVTPGPTRTALWEAPDQFGARLAAAADTEHPTFLENVPGFLGITTGRLSEPAEVAALVAFLASSAAANVTGADFRVDGGFIKTV